MLSGVLNVLIINRAQDIIFRELDDTLQVEDNTSREMLLLKIPTFCLEASRF